jgi:hypothetical protein
MDTKRRLRAFVLAAVGWYLLVPNPLIKGKYKGYPDVGAPLARWTIYQSFDSAKDCEKAKEKLVNKFSTGPVSLKALVWTQSFVCIATDDPRLR